MAKNPIERALGVWSAANYRNVMLPGLGVVTCGELCDALADLKAENKEQRERLIQFANAFDAGYAAAERALAERAAVKVKALEWEGRSGTFYADTALGEVCIDVDGDGFYVIENGRKHSEFASIKSAQAFVQMNHDKWVEDWLEPYALTTEPAAPEGRQEAVAWLAEGPGWKRVFLNKEAADNLAKGEWGASVSPLTRPSEQAVTEAMVEAAREIIHGARHVYSDEDLAAAALKAAMEAGR